MWFVCCPPVRGRESARRAVCRRCAFRAGVGGTRGQGGKPAVSATTPLRSTSPHMHALGTLSRRLGFVSTPDEANTDEKTKITNLDTET